MINNVEAVPNAMITINNSITDSAIATNKVLKTSISELKNIHSFLQTNQVSEKMKTKFVKGFGMLKKAVNILLKMIQDKTSSVLGLIDGIIATLSGGDVNNNVPGAPKLVAQVNDETLNQNGAAQKVDNHQKKDGKAQKLDELLKLVRQVENQLKEGTVIDAATVEKVENQVLLVKALSDPLSDLQRELSALPFLYQSY